MSLLLPIPLLSWSWVLLIYILAAVIPAVILLRYVYRHDTIEQEPASLIWSLILGGLLAVFASIVLEEIGVRILNRTVSKASPHYVILLAFLVVAVVEEGTKLYFLYKRAWRNPNFNYLYDGIVYSASVSLGFAAFENIKYVFSYGLQVALPRAITAIPGHLAFSVFMGAFFGKAKLCEMQGDEAGKKRNLRMGYLTAVFLHGFYDSCAMIQTSLSSLLFLVFIAIMFLRVRSLIKEVSRNDRALY